MAHCLNAASKLDWIDVILMSYNFRLMQDKLLMSAIDACHKAGIGIIAMKTQGHGVGRPEETFRGRHSISTEADQKLVEHLLKGGYTKGQAKIKLVLEDERISSACVGVKNVSLLRSNVSSIMDQKKLSQAGKVAFSEYAKASCSGYCAGCAEICEPALEGLPISDIMRYLMYYKDYGDTEGAKELFSQLPRKIIRRLSSVDYSAVESLCPQHLPIGALIAEATKKLC
jgi:predicted aldo/keto reductase-like oxidoreductase